MKTERSMEEIVDFLAQMPVRMTRTADLLAELEYTSYELGELAQKGDPDSDYARYLKGRALVLSAEAERRATIKPDIGKASIPYEFISELKQSVDIEDTFNRILGIFARPVSDTRSVYACPSHPDKHPSGMIYRDEGRYHCFQCHASGDAYDALMAFRGMTFVQAVKTIAQWCHREIPRPKAQGAARGCVLI